VCVCLASLLKLSFEHIPQKLQQIQSELDPDELMAEAFSFNLSRTLLRAYEKQYLAQIAKGKRKGGP